MTLIAVKTAQPAALVHDGCPAMHGTGCVCEAGFERDACPHTSESGARVWMWRCDGCGRLGAPMDFIPPAGLNNSYVRLTRMVYDGNRATAPVYINRHQVTDVTDDHKGNVFINLIGERTVQVAESLECVVEALG